MPASAEGRLGELIADCRANDVCEPLCEYHWEFIVADVEADPGVRDCERAGDTITYEGHTTCAAGRRPSSSTGDRAAARDGAGGYFAMQAALEAASVRAFADLFADLAHHAAPRALRRAAMQAAIDEIRHAELCAVLARRHGGVPATRAIAAAPRRSLHDLALDNVVEGCVRETFGAALAAHQATAASDPVVRAAMRAIALDETRHAQLAWNIHAWLAPQLDPAVLPVLRDRARAEWNALATTTGDPRLATIVGLPDARSQAHLVARLVESAWRML